MKDGERHGDEYYLRCPSCGDSQKDPNKAHFSVNLRTGKFYCLRCGYGGVMDHRSLLTMVVSNFRTIDLTPRQDPYTEVDALEDHLLEGPGAARYSILYRQHFTAKQGMVDVFQNRRPDGEVVGYYLRTSWKKFSLMVGKRALGFYGSSLQANWVRLVEGPYDAVDPFHDVATYGFPAPSQLEMLRGIPLVLCPDGDVWQDPERLKAYFKRFINRRYVLLGAERLPDGLDPDEVPPKERERVSQKQLHHLLEQLKPHVQPVPKFRQTPKMLGVV